MLAEQKAAKEWQPEQVQFMRWLALPKKARSPKTQQQFAKEIGVHETTLSDWKRIDGFMTEVKLISVSLVDDEVPEVIAKIVSQAKHGSFAHQQMVLEMAQVYVQRTRNEHTGADGGPIKVKGYIGFSPDEWDDDRTD